ncbi:MAG: ABC transporter permease [Gemmatimonadaceae bacterium]|nr:ABC transporter permease [Gemmatimonadaceae bacterium]
MRDSILQALSTLQEVTLLAWRTLRGWHGGRGGSARLLVQLDAVGVQSLPIVLLTGLFTGMVLALQASVQLAPFGATLYVGRFVAASMVRELGPVLSGIMVAGRVGAGIAAELGAMRVTEQVDAIETMGADPVRLLVVPRVLAAAIAVPLLALLADVAGLLGATVVAAVWLGVPARTFWQAAADQLRADGMLWGILPADLVQGLVKPLVFGILLALLACHHGLAARGGTAGVGIATTRAVVSASITILVADYFLTQLLLVLV